MPLGYGHYAIYQNNATYFTHPNALGSTTMVTDYNGNVVQDKIFYPWGQDWQTVGTVYDERFAKLQHRDTETGFDPTSHRAYCSGYGRWLSPDPLGGDVSNPQSLNRYAYAVGDLADALALAESLISKFEPLVYPPRSLNRFVLFRRRAQLLMEKNPADKPFVDVMKQAEEQVCGDANRPFTLEIVHTAPTLPSRHDSRNQASLRCACANRGQFR